MLMRYMLSLEGDGHSPKTILEYRRTIGRWERSGLDALAHLTTSPIVASTRATRGRILSHYFDWGVQHGFLSENPLKGIRFRMPPAPQVRPFSQEEIGVLLVNCKGRVERAVLVALLHTGLRASELADVRQGDIDEVASVIRVRSGKGGKGRMVAASPAALGAIRILQSVKVFNYQTVYRSMRKIGRRAGIKNVHPHRARHTFAHWFLISGGDRGDLRVILGHTSYQMVDRYCAYYEGERAVEAHRRLLANNGSAYMAA